MELVDPCARLPADAASVSAATAASAGQRSGALPARPGSSGAL